MTRHGTRGIRHSRASPPEHATIVPVTISQSAPGGPVRGPSGRTAVLVLVAAVLVAMLALPIRSWFLQQAQIADMEAALAETDAALAALELQRRDWRDDAYVEQQARLRLNYVFPGEVGIVVLTPQDEQLAGGGRPGTWYESLWQSVESASGRGDAAVGEPVEVRESAPR